MSLTVFKSSAGSGKTYTLSKEYLKLSLRTPDYYQKILAVTFTNKAAEEMKERVLEFLIAISKGKHELIKQYADDLNVSEEEVSMRAKRSLTHILHHYSFFNITTIDKFFHRVIRAFSREIGLQGNFGIEADTDKVTEILAADLYEGVEDDKALKEWLVSFSLDRLEDGKGYEFKNDVRELSKQLFSEDFKKMGKDQLNDPKLKERIKVLQQQLFGLKHAYEKKLKGWGDQFFDLLKQEDLQVSDLPHGGNGVAGFFIKLREKNYKNLLGVRVLACKANPESWVKKKDPKRDQILHLAESKFMTLLNEAIAYIEDQEKSYYTAKVVLRHLYTLGLLSDLNQRLGLYKQEKEVILISDLPDFLNQIIHDSDAPFIYEKVGSYYRHYFIDEFQDTSFFQWRNFRPLIQESLATGNESIIVGDAKQSIYRWRGGDPSLLMKQVATDIPGAVIENQNQTNYRSARNIVAFNNAVFAKLPVLIATLMEDAFSEEDANKFTDAYVQVNQQVATKNESVEGLVQFEFLEKEEETGYNQLAMERMVELVERLVADQHSLHDMAILVRTNKEAELIVNYVLNYKQEKQSTLEVISAEGMLLKNSHTVKLLLTTLRYLIDPEDAVIEATLVYQYQKLVAEKKVENHEDFIGLNDECLPEEFKKYRQHLLQLPIYEVIEVLIRLFKLSELNQEYSYLQAFQDAVLEFGKNNRSDIRKFLEWWEEEGEKKSVRLTGTRNAIEIITSHKSKGLQYPIVIIPFCTFNLDSKTHTTWYNSPEEKPFSGLSYFPLQYASGLANTFFEEAYKSERADCYLETLNILYVAFTRAERGLYVFSKIPSEKSASQTLDVSKVLWKYFECENPKGWDSSARVFRMGTLKTDCNAEETDMVKLENYPSNKWSNRMTIRKKGSGIYDKKVAAKQNEGILIHRILSEIIHFEDTSFVFDRYQSRMELTQKDRQRYENLIMKLWQNDTIKGWFSGKGEVKTEVLVLPKDGEIRRMDRVIINGDQAVVIDFKSGEPKNGDEMQLKEYIRLVGDMGYKTKGYLLYLNDAMLIKIDSPPAIRVVS